MKKRIDWLNHTLEFLVVLVGILIAFQLNKCSDNNSKKELLNNHLKYIKLECKENKERLETSIKHTEDQLLICDSLLTEILYSKDINRIRNLSAKLLDLRNVDLVNDSYHVLSESGDIRFLKDYNRKRQIITLYDTFDKVESINDNNQKLYDNHFYPYLKENFDLINWNFLDIKDESKAQKYYSSEYGNIISTYQFLLNSKLKIYKKERNLIMKYSH